jgi:hypothetical protein
VATTIRLCLLGLLVLASCEPGPVGRMCEALPGAADAATDARETIVNDRALECRSQLCLQQAPAVGIAHDVDTSGLCTVDCRRDSDCEDGERRDPARSGDRRCRTGFYCGVPLSTGTIAAGRRLCLCRDFGDVRASTAALAGAPL